MKQDILNEIHRIHQIMGVKSIIKENPPVLSRVAFELEEKTLKTRWKDAYNAVKSELDMGYLTKSEAEAKVNKLIDQLVGITDDTERASFRQSKIAKLGSVATDTSDDLDKLAVKIEKSGKEYAERIKNIDETWTELENLIDDGLKNVWDSESNILGVQGIKQNLDDMVIDCKTPDPNYPGEYPYRDVYKEEYPTKQHLTSSLDAEIDRLVDITHPIPIGLSAEDQLRYQKLNNLRKQFLKNKINDYTDLDFVWYGTSEVSSRMVGGVKQDLPTDIDYQITKLKEKIKTNGGSSLSESEIEVLSLFQKWKKGEDIDLVDLRSKIRDMKPKVPVGSEVVGKKIPLIFRKIIGPLGDWFYEHFVLWWRQWIASIRLFITGGKFDYDRFSTIFYKELNESIQKYGANALTKRSSIIQIVNALETAPAQLLRDGGGFITGESPLYKEIWEKFKMEGAEHFKGKVEVVNGKEVSLETAFKNFCDQIENYKGDHPIMKDRKFGGLKALMEEMDEAGEETTKNVSKNSERGSILDVIKDADKMENTFKKLAKDAWDFLRSNRFLRNVYTFFRGGNFVTPKEFTDYITSKFKTIANESPEQLQKRVFGVTGTQAIAGTWLMKRAFYMFIVIPAIVATVQFVYDCWFLSMYNIKGQTKQEGYFFDEDDDVSIGTWGNYVIYRIVEEALGSSVLIDGLKTIAFERDSNGGSWSDYVEGTLSLMPGYTENPIIWLAGRIDDAEKGDKTEKQIATEIYEETSKDFTQVTLDSANKKLEEEGNKIIESAGKDPNSIKWEKEFFSKRLDMDYLYNPKYREKEKGSIWDVLIEKGVITNSDKNRILKEKELKFGLNPAYMYENSDKVNINKMEFINKVQNLKLKDLAITQKESLSFAEKISGVISNITNSPGASKANPFMLIGKDGKKYILKNLTSAEENNEKGELITRLKFNEGYNQNTIQFYTPDYKTLYDAIYDPNKVLVPNDFKIPSGSKLTEQNLVRVSLNPITKF